MKITIKIMLMSLAIIFTINANAQSKLEEKAQAETEKITAALELNDETSTQIYEAVLKAKKKSRKVAKAYKAEEIDETEKKAQMKAINKTKHDTFKTILSKEQMKKYWIFKKNMKAAKEAAKN